MVLLRFDYAFLTQFFSKRQYMKAWFRFFPQNIPQSASWYKFSYDPDWCAVCKLNSFPVRWLDQSAHITLAHKLFLLNKVIISTVRYIVLRLLIYMNKLKGGKGSDVNYFQHQLLGCYGACISVCEEMLMFSCSDSTYTIIHSMTCREMFFYDCPVMEIKM